MAEDTIDYNDGDEKFMMICGPVLTRSCPACAGPDRAETSPPSYDAIMMSPVHIGRLDLHVDCI